MIWVLIVIGVLIMVLIITNIRIVPQSDAYVITGCGGKSNTFSLSETFFAMRSMSGIFTCKPTFQVLWNPPRRSIT